ncbi:BZ3500_MvSof-1268-A1-R1_Chr9g10403 [Microbotryum saponariae]|uniref:BZ3500_MvSof-1268-A1-R1_Chr9g10403 protein n=1 Tax=Microbotryum saponariae TaxID=289078 RepID=A0A2X0LLY4_9BASI|nr:BZ3501_MvSof-1269-A2-R1_Chr9g10153 [Microbotryum saponariae]SDA00033.1 BZ3500_MvSof-1268-A1-R1_Chr9g10403 [Microbotryum saponariae]
MSIPPNYHGPINANPSSGETTISIFGYIPSRALASIAAIVFALGLLCHVVYLIRCVCEGWMGRVGLPGTRSFQSLLAIGCAMEVGGYIVRILAHHHPFLVSFYVAQYFLIVYLALGLAIKRLPVTLAHGLLSFPPKIFIIILIIADIVTTAIQITGAALIGAAESSRTPGSVPTAITSAQANDILLSGLAIQSVSFLAFIYILSLVAYRSNQVRPHVLPPRFSAALIISSLLVFLRTVFRLAEVAQGVFGFASTHEVLFGVLEFAPVALAMSIWAALSLDELLPLARANHEIEKWDGKRANYGGIEIVNTVTKGS